jgi:RES domain-containing protein
VSLDLLLSPWNGEAFRHIPKGSPYGPLDFRFAGLATDNRWNYPGQRTLHLGRDRGVVVGEFSRHLQEKRTPQIARQIVARQLFRLRLEIEWMLDLTSPEVRKALSLPSDPTCFLSVDYARATAHFVRFTTRAQGLVVPSMCFLDDVSRWCLVLFLEKLSAEPRDYVKAVDAWGELQLTDPIR